MGKRKCGGCARWDDGRCSKFNGFYQKDDLAANSCKLYKGGAANIAVKTSRVIYRGTKKITKKIKEKIKGVKNV